MPAHPDQVGRCAGRRRKGTARADHVDRRAFISSSATSAALRAPSACIAAIDASQRTRPAQGRRAAHQPAEDPRTPRPRDADDGRERRRRPHGPGMKLLFIGDIVARPGRELVRRGVRTLVRAPCDRPRDRQRRERRRRRRASRVRFCDEVLKAGDRRADVRQSHLGQARGARVHRQQAAAAAAGQLSGRRAGRRIVRLAGARRHVGGRDQRHGPRVPGEHRRPLRDRHPTDRARSRGRCARSSSSTFMPKRPPRNSRSAGISTDG